MLTDRVTATEERRRRWPVLFPLALTAAFAAVVGLSLGGKWFALVVDDLGELVAAAWAGWACLRTARRKPCRSGPWLALGAGVLCWAAGQAVWSWLELVKHQSNPFPSPADIGFLLFVPLAIWGIAWLAEAPAGMLSKLRCLLEAALVGSAVFYISWVVVLERMFHDDAEPVFTRAVSLAYPGGDVIMAAVALIAIFRAGRRGAHTLAWVGVGALALALSDSAFAYLSETGAYGATQFIDAGWVLGFVAIGIGAGWASAITTAAPKETGPPTRLALLAPFAVVVPAVAMRVMLFGDGPQSMGRQLAYTAMVCALIANIVAVVLENHALTSTLEARVRARTADVRAGEHRLFALLQDVSEVVLVCDAELVVRYASESAARVLGRSPAELTGEAITALAAPGDKEHLLLAVGQAVERGAAPALEIALAGSSPGDERWALLGVRNMLDEPTIAGLVVNLRETTDNRRLEDELRGMALRDALTGLPNRTLFSERLDQALARHRRDGPPVWVGVIDLDGFKTVNDSLGHHAGDELLRLVAGRFDPCLRGNDTVARLGGDEFALLVESDEGGPRVAQRLLDALRTPFDLQGHEVSISASVGLAVGTVADEGDDLVRQADTAMYASKRTGRGHFAEYEPAMYHDAVAKLELEADLKRALERGQLHLAYQPTVDVATGNVLGFEALLRWIHPERGAVGPVEFIPAAEESGAIVPIGRWVLEEACRQAAAWQRPDRPPVSVSVNVSVAQLRTGNMVADVDAALAGSGLDPHCLVVELTESVMLDDRPEFVAFLHELRTRGVRVAIDDFGTGYSSLAYLQRLPVDILKVDKAFVDHLGESGKADSMVRAIVELAGSLSAATVAEGVERPEQAESLRALGCHAAQGFLYARPLTPSAATMLVQQGRSLSPIPQPL